MAKKDDKMTVVSQGGPLEKAPDWIEDSSAGTEHITRADIKIPRLCIAQANSPQVEEDGEKLILGLKVGDMFNDLTEEIYGRESMEFIIIRSDKPRGVEFLPIDDGGGVVDLNVPLDDPRMKFGADGTKPTATKFYDFIIVLLPKMEMVALSFKSTGLKTAMQLNGLIKTRQKALYAGKYIIGVVKAKRKDKTFYMHTVKNAGWADQETYEACKKKYEDIKDKVIDMEREADDEASQPAAANPDDFVAPDGETRF